MPARRTSTTRRHSRLATLALLAVTISWGSTFFLIKDLLERIPASDFLVLRFSLAAIVLFVVAPGAVARMSREARRHGVLLGLVYGIAQLLQTVGLAHTSASVSGFITGMYVVATPVIGGLILRERVPAVVWAAVALATVGLGVLSLTGFSLGYGETLTLLAALLYGMHIVGLGAWSTTADAIGLSLLQMIVVAFVCLLPTVHDGIVLPHRLGDWAAVLYMAVVCAALAMLAQTWAQAHLPAARAAIVMTMEPVFAAGFAVVFTAETLSWRMVIGGGLVLGAMYVVELSPRRHVEAQVPHLTQ